MTRTLDMTSQRRARTGDCRRKREQLAVVGHCLSGAFPPADQGMDELLRKLALVGQATSRGNSDR